MKSIKYLLDYIIASLLIVLLSPLLIWLTILIKIKMGGPVIFTQNRPGYKGKIFKIYKFRTMVNIYDTKGELLPDHKRITKLGKLMRSLSLDELPQLFNILKGELSLIGPRPLLVEYLRLYSSQEKERHNMKPGMTGWAQVNGRNTITWKKKFALDTWYINNWSFRLDIKIVCLTILKVFKRSDIQQDTNLTMPPYNGKN